VKWWQFAIDLLQSLLFSGTFWKTIVFMPRKSYYLSIAEGVERGKSLSLSRIVARCLLFFIWPPTSSSSSSSCHPHSRFVWDAPAETNEDGSFQLVARWGWGLEIVRPKTNIFNKLISGCALIGKSAVENCRAKRATERNTQFFSTRSLIAFVACQLANA